MKGGRILLCFGLHGIAREVDRALGLLLHTSLDVPGVILAVPAALEPDAGRRLGAWALAGIVAWLASRRRLAAVSFAPLLIRPVVTLVALVSVALDPRYPYGFTFPVALTQDWAPMQDAAALAAFLAALPWGAFPLARRIPVPSPVQVGALFIAAFLWLVPPSMKLYDGHTGNEPKTMRMAVSLGLWGSLDVENVTGPMETLAPRSFAANLGAAARTAIDQGMAMVRAARPGGDGLGAASIKATRVFRQTVAGKDGGVYHVLAPGPSFLLAPLLRLDRAFNLALSTPGRLRVSLLFWFVLSAAIPVLVLRVLGMLDGRSGGAVLIVAASALAPPLVFFFYQFYPESLGGLGLLWIAKRAFLQGRIDAGRLEPLAWAIAFAPWLHQKFVPVWLVLVAVVVAKAVHDLADGQSLWTLLWPQAASAFAYALYNFAITGSARPDALFLAWGPGGVSSERMGLGLVGLLLDARYGLVPYVPLLLLAPAGVVLLWQRRSPLLWVLVPAAAYYLTVASANNWAGSISNLGRFLLVLVPLLVVFAGVVWRHIGADPGRLAVCVTLVLWTLVLSRGLWNDPHGANDCALFLQKSVFADGNLYIPNLWLPSWSHAAPGLYERLGLWIGFAVALTSWLVRAGRGGVLAPLPAVAGMLAVIAGAGWLLELRSPLRPEAVRTNRLEVRRGVTAFVERGAEVHRSKTAVAGGGEVRFVVRSFEPIASMTVMAFGEGFARSNDGYAALKPSGVRLRVHLAPITTLRGRGGVEERLLRGTLRLQARGPVSVEIAR